MKHLPVMVMMVTLAACSGSDTPEPAAAAKGTVSKDNAFSADVQAMARAKQVDKTVQDAAAQQREDIDANQ